MHRKIVSMAPFIYAIIARKIMEKVKQTLIWSGNPVKANNMVGFKFMPIPFDKGEIHRLYTLYHFTDENKPPELPFSPVHNINAFIEDKGHDWSQNDREIRFTSRVVDQGVWLLAELK
ncbi:TPA: hypothetical protein RQN23_000828 [Aeromonas veronii]|nr:hypothetical protein [Aeromonas veronii]